MSQIRTNTPAGPGTYPKAMRERAESSWRMFAMAFVFVLIYVTAGVRMGYMAAYDPTEPRLSGHSGAEKPVRGEIVDRQGRLLAANLPAWSLYAHPRVIKNPTRVAQDLARIFPDLDVKTILARLTSQRQFVWIKRPISPHQMQQVHDLGHPGLYFGSRPLRIYPPGRAVSHLMGRVKAGREGVRFAELVGAGGVERYFDERLRDPATLQKPLRLSIDLVAQQAVRDLLAAGVERYHAIGASAVVMKVQTGEILAMVSLPDFDPNAPLKPFQGSPDRNPRFNRVVQGRYELGSTFKVLTAAMALDMGVVQPDTLIETGAPLVYGRRRIHDFHRMPPKLSVTDVIVKSSNVGSARLALMVGTPRFKSYLKALGFNEPTGLELAEAQGQKPLQPAPWTDLSTMTISYGHGLAASPLHLAAAYATIANGGRRVWPTLLAGGKKEDNVQIFSPRTSQEMLGIMREVVHRGTGRRTDLPGYEVGGKTGTADKVKPGGGYYNKKVISTFAAVFPTSRPEYVVIVSLDEPTDTSGPFPVRTAGRTAAPVMGEIIARLAPLMGLWPLPRPDATLAEAATAQAHNGE